jgi:hypothetical protein
MGKDSNIVHQYFRKAFSDFTILVKVNPIHLSGIELTILANGKITARELEFDKSIHEDLSTDGFEEASALEFNLYYSGLI